MPPNAWAVFVSFGIPATLGVIGVVHAGRLFARAYRRGAVPADLTVPSDEATGRSEHDGSPRRDLLWAGLLFVGSALLLAHSGGWLLRIYGLV